MKPIIGITTFQSKNANGQPTVVLMQSYIHAIIQAGGVPVLIPSMIAENGWDALYSRLDGILFSGGGDIALEYSPGEPHPRIDDVDLERDRPAELHRPHAQDGYIQTCVAAAYISYLPPQLHYIPIAGTIRIKTKKRLSLGQPFF